jgi:hypothetical protein
MGRDCASQVVESKKGLEFLGLLSLADSIGIDDTDNPADSDDKHCDVEY